MKRLQFYYHMEISFSDPVFDHSYTLKCFPQTTGTQRITECNYHILPEGEMQEGKDSFGNRMIYGTAKEAHRLFRVDVTGIADTGIFPADVPEEENDSAVYRYHTSLTQCGGHIRELLALCREQVQEMSQASFREKMCVYMRIVHKAMAYQKSITDVTTSAEKALSLGGGVCQDFSHVLLALCREERIPARYVVGMLMGEGESHAWVEVLEDGHWFGLDPTNDVLTGDSYIKISHGRDYQDCSINRGVFTGRTRQNQSILVKVTRMQA